jgi:hypothetical protein|tara:strand:- start:2347 stop:2589 length:243 start_codon:yes stop_codon:yes gene_type:complete
MEFSDFLVKFIAVLMLYLSYVTQPLFTVFFLVVILVLLVKDRKVSEENERNRPKPLEGFASKKRSGIRYFFTGNPRYKKY